jgi:hypothetical protein
LGIIISPFLITFLIIFLLKGVPHDKISN